jgi:hypothetical protein
MIFFFYLKNHDSEKPIRLEGDSRVVEGQFCIVRKNGEIVGQVDWGDIICWHDERAVPKT